MKKMKSCVEGEEFEKNERAASICGGGHIRVFTRCLRLFKCSC